MISKSERFWEYLSLFFSFFQAIKLTSFSSFVGKRGLNFSPGLVSNTHFVTQNTRFSQAFLVHRSSESSHSSQFFETNRRILLITSKQRSNCIHFAAVEIILNFSYFLERSSFYRILKFLEVLILASTSTSCGTLVRNSQKTYENFLR